VVTGSSPVLSEIDVIRMINQLIAATNQGTHIETAMATVERVVVYSSPSFERERLFNIVSTLPPAEWPEKGGIRFENVQMAYREGLPNVLKGLSLDIMPGEKVGIVGRTGAGKSSITVALFRLVE
jgi:ATP-binding cassette, subfamily C (CFTR/MRP), member 1